MARLAGSTNLNPELIKFIYARVLLLPKIPKISRETLATALKYEIEAEAEERVNWRVPSHENLIKMISEARNHTPNHLDEPWSIAASVEHGIPPDANKDLFDIWRVSLAIDRPISVRQARWIVYLRNVSPEHLPQGTYSEKVRRSLGLISQSWLYSIREQVSEIMREEHFDTTALDAASFMPPWEKATALKLGKVSPLSFPQEQLKKIEEFGTSLKSPPVSIKSVEQAVWHNVRAEPPQHEEIMAIGFTDEVLPEEDDLISAYWLMHLSKGPLWNKLPEQPELQKILKVRRQRRERGDFVPDSGGAYDDTLYSRQSSIRRKLREWVTAYSKMSMRDYYSLSGLSAAPEPTGLLKLVGYEITEKDAQLWFEHYEKELKAQHQGWNRLPAEVQTRFIHCGQTYDDLHALSNADNQSVVEQRQLEQEFIELVKRKGGVPTSKARGEIETFWVSVRDEWVKKYPEYIKRGVLGYLQWEEVKAEYERLIDEQQKEAHNERVNKAKR